MSGISELRQQAWVIWTLQALVGLAYLAAVSTALAQPVGAIKTQLDLQIPVERHVDVAAFEALHIDGHVTVTIYQAERPWLRIQGDKAALDGTRFEVTDGVLYIEASGDHAPSKLTVSVGVSELREVVFDGAGVVKGAGLAMRDLLLEGNDASRFAFSELRVRDLVVVGNGHTSFELSGSAVNQSIDLAGYSDYRAPKLRSQTAMVSVKGDGVVDLWTDALLDVLVLGKADVRYSGDPWVRRQVLGHGAIHPHTHNASLRL